MNKCEYVFATIAEYPELKDYLVKRISELGSVRIKNMWETLDDNGEYIVSFSFRKPPVVVDWHKNPSFLGLHINSDAGGCFIQGLANCRTLPRPNSRDAVFDFSLTLDSRDAINIDDKSILIKRIDEFVERSKVGFCYHFGGAYCRDLKSGYGE